MVSIYNLIIETTRRCNMSCEHCLRGEPQNRDIDVDTIRKFLLTNNVNYISIITFTGGESTLNLQAIRSFMQICKDLNVDVGSFYIATNGKNIPDEFILCLDLYLFCSDNEVSAVGISKSFYHNKQRTFEDEQGSRN